jgi:hypothetical protein
MRRITCFLCALVAGTAQAAVTTVNSKNNGRSIPEILAGTGMGV